FAVKQKAPGFPAVSGFPDDDGSSPPALPTYHWRILPGMRILELAGPLDRAVSRRRTRRIHLQHLASELRSFIEAARPEAVGTPASTRVRAGKRQLLVVGEAGNIGYLVDLTRDLRHRARIARFAYRLEEGINALP